MARRITMEDVAKKAGVSRALVSLAYRNAFGVSETTRQHILETGEALGYVPNSAAAALATNQPQPLGIFIQDLHNSIFASIYEGIRDVLEVDKRNFMVTIGSLDGTRDDPSLTTLEAARVESIIAAGLTLPTEEAIRHNRRTRLISITRVIEGIDSVYPNDVRGGQLATEHLLGLGHTKIAHIANPDLEGYTGREEGYIATMQQAGLTPRVLRTSFAREDAAQAAYQLLDSDNPPTAVFVHNDRGALGVLDALAKRGLKAGVDLSVIGYDNTVASSAPGTDLTTIDLHGYELGRAAAEIALAAPREPGQKPHYREVEPTLVVRSTTAPPRV